MKKIIVTPAGRQRYLEILLQNLLNNKNEFDIWELWVNTTDQSDIEYMQSIEKEYDFIRLKYSSIPINGSYSIHNFFKDCIDVDSVYLRLDDDIVYCHPGSITTMFNARINDEEPFLYYGNIVNNSVITHLHQRMRIMPVTKTVHYNCMDQVGWNDPMFAHEVHNNFFDKELNNKLDSYYMNDWLLYDYSRVSINVISWLGKKFAEFNGVVGADEELWLAVEKPRDIAKPNVIKGNTLFVHYSFYTQRPYLDTTDVLSKYKILSTKNKYE